MRGWPVAIALCGCRQILGVDTPVLEQSDAASSDAPTSITLTGLIAENGGGSAIANAMVGWETDPNAKVVAMTTTGTDGKFQLVLPYQGTPLVGYVHVVHATYLDTYFYPANPLTADGQVTLAVVTPNTVALLCSAGAVTCDSTKGLIALSVVNATATAALPGVTVSSAPAGTVRYDGANGIPSSSATSTGNDGVAYILNIPAGGVTVDATLPGKTFGQHTLYARANVFTITNIFQIGP